MPAQTVVAQKKYLENLEWRYATKKFNPEGRIPESEFNELMDAVRLTASSYGLQPYVVVVVESTEVRKALQPACWNQPQITEASHLVILAHRTDFDESLIDSYLAEVSRERAIDPKQLKGYADFMKSKLLDWPAAQKAEWTARQAYIALGNLLSAAADFRIDACPIEGFEAARVNEILNLDSRGLSASVITALGYRSEEDATQYQQKVRRPKEDFFIHI